jgi:iron complex outermembrane receptor protein
MIRRRAPALAGWSLLLLAAAPAWADEPRGSRDPRPEKEVTLDEVVVTANPEEEGASARTVKRKEIERRGATTAAEVLEGDPSIHATTGTRGERIFTFRGFDQRQVVVLMDGAPAYLPYEGQADTSYLPAEMIDHITIVKGPASVLYGPNGLGGAINIVTRRPGAGPLLGAAAEYGRAGSLLASGLHSGSVGLLGYTVHGGVKRRDAFALPSDFAPVPRENGALRENSDSLLYHVGGSFRLGLPRGHALSASLAYLDGERGVPPALMDPVVRYWRFSTSRNVSASLGHAASYLDRKLEVDENLYLRLYDNLLDSFDDPTYTTQLLPRAFHDWYHDQTWGGRVRVRYWIDRAPWGRTQLRLWAGAQHDRHEKVPSSDPVPSNQVTRSLVTVAPEAEAFLGERWSVMAAFQIDLEVPGEASLPSLSARIGWGPLLSGRFDPVEGVSLRATVARRTRFPTLKERFSSGLGARLPNPDLGPESAWHFGLEASWQARRWLLVQASVYDAEVADLVEAVTVGGQEQLQNVPGARLLGAELSCEVTPWRWLGLRVGYNYLRARRTEELGGSDALEYRPDHKASIELIARPLATVELSTSLRVIGARDYRHPASELWQSLDPYAAWDAQLTVRPTRWSTVWLRARNLLDASFESQYGFPEPGQEVWVGLRVTYDRAGAR